VGRVSSKCGSLDVSQTYKPPCPVVRIDLVYFLSTYEVGEHLKNPPVLKNIEKNK
jgi:hypothetical protein